MENENINNSEQENTLTPEEKVQLDISEKIADAAGEIQDEIDEANGVVKEETYDFFNADADVQVEEAPEPVKVTIKRSSFIMSLIASVLAGALLCFAGMQIPKAIANMPEGKKIASVNGEEITDLDVNYYIYAIAAEYANTNGLLQEDLADYDWDQEVDGEKLSDKIKADAVDAAIDEVMTIQKGAENDIKLDDATKSQIESQVSSLKGAYGEDGFALRARTMGISSLKQYSKMYEKVMTVQSVQSDIEANPSKYYPEDTSVLNDYKQDDKASVKHILIKFSDEEGFDAQAKAQEVLDRINAGEDFDTVMLEENEDTGETEAGYTFGKGEMDEAFEAASFALNIGEMSGLVESSFGYHIIKRVPGMYELQGYWRDENVKNIKINKGKLAKLSVKDVMSDVIAANEELQNQQSAQQSSGN